MPNTEGPAAPRVLFLADNASSVFGGEAIIPLKYFVLLARRGRDVQLVTHERNREALSAEFPDLIDKITFSVETKTHRWLWNIGLKLPDTIRYHIFGNLMVLLTMAQQRRIARQKVRDGEIDLVHQPIPVSPTAPSSMYGIGVPVVIGPMNGAMVYPPGYEDFEGRASRLFVALGRPLSGLANRLIPGKRRAALLLVANQRTRRALPKSKAPVVELVENAVDFDVWRASHDDQPSTGAFRIAFMGRLIPFKGLTQTLDALAEVKQRYPDRQVTLDILGDGPERDGLQAQAERLGLSESVHFHGFKRQRECAQVLAKSDALILATLWDCGGAVVLEAMAMGLAVIASDWGGPVDYVDDSCGILVPPSPRDEFVPRLADAIIDLASNPEKTRAMGEAGKAQVLANFDWQRKIDRMEELYRQAVEHKP